MAERTSSVHFLKSISSPLRCGGISGYLGSGCQRGARQILLSFTSTCAPPQASDAGGSPPRVGVRSSPDHISKRYKPATKIADELGFHLPARNVAGRLTSSALPPYRTSSTASAHTPPILSPRALAPHISSPPTAGLSRNRSASRCHLAELWSCFPPYTVRRRLPLTSAPTANAIRGA